MGKALRIHRHSRPRRGGERVSLHARVRLWTPDGQDLAPLARCTDIGLGGVHVYAAAGLSPGMQVQLEIRLPSGRTFSCAGHVAWSKTTLHPALFGSTEGMDNDGSFGICFDDVSTQDILPIARLLVARDHERNRARRIRRLHGLPNHA
ncbi:MAG: PilZ domain-containing protein [Myxococcota bacterium]